MTVELVHVSWRNARRIDPYTSMAAPKIESLKELKQSEARELRRVFDLLAGFSSRQRLRRLLAPALECRAKLIADQLSNDNSSDELTKKNAVVALKEGLSHVEEDITALQRRIADVDAVPEAERKIQSKDLQSALAMLGKACDKVKNQIVLKETLVATRSLPDYCRLVCDNYCC